MKADTMQLEIRSSRMKLTSFFESSSVGKKGA
jgi:hypothetical protein